MLFRNRVEAGRRLAAELTNYADRPDVLVLALPRGGVPVGYEVARALHAPLDVFLVRKLGVPGRPELAMGAIASGGTRVLNEELLGMLSVPPRRIAEVAQREQRELDRRERLYRGSRLPPEIREKTVILVDDGLATGSTMRAAVLALRQLQPARIVVAVPVGAKQTCAEFESEADETICATTPEPFHAVGAWYDNFDPTSDDEVRRLLARASEELRAAVPAAT
ncbi:MAG TPA: phosphoribosyltransferase [Pirellulaceae bacterium]|nr:phosphoribosyltransferase [Pirellulaceae bacterium]